MFYFEPLNPPNDTEVGSDIETQRHATNPLPNEQLGKKTPGTVQRTIPQLKNTDGFQAYCGLIFCVHKRCWLSLVSSPHHLFFYPDFHARQHDLGSDMPGCMLDRSESAANHDPLTLDATNCLPSRTEDKTNTK